MSYGMMEHKHEHGIGFSRKASWAPWRETFASWQEQEQLSARLRSPAHNCNAHGWAMRGNTKSGCQKAGCTALYAEDWHCNCDRTLRACHSHRDELHDAGWPYDPEKDQGSIS